MSGRLDLKIENSGVEPGTIEASFPQDVVDLIGFVNSANESYAPDFPNLISRLDLNRWFPVIDSNYTKGQNVSEENSLRVKNLLSSKIRCSHNDDTITEHDYLNELFNDPEKIAQIKRVFERSIAYMEEVLELSIPSQVRNEINGIRGITDILRFIGRAQGFGKTILGPFICGVLKVADVIIELDAQREGLESLRSQTESLEAAMLGQVPIEGWQNTEEKSLKTPKTQNGNLLFQGASSSFRASSVHLNAKSENRMISKLLRKVGVNASDMIKDGVQMRVIVPDHTPNDGRMERIQNFFETMPGYYFQLNSGLKGATRDPNRKEIKFAGFKLRPGESAPVPGEHIPSSRFDTEVQVVTESEYFRNENGPRNHTVYEALQNFQCMARLFGSISRRQYEDKIEALAAEIYTDTDGNDYQVGIDKISKQFETHFYLGSRQLQRQIS